jgi:hypothetical protein
VPGGTNATLTIATVVPTDGGTYSVLVSNSIGSVVSSNAVLLVNSFIETMPGQPQQLAATNLTVPSSVQPSNTFAVSAVHLMSLQGGQVQLTNDTITYTPPAGFMGMDSFGYVLTPASGPSFNGTITALVNASLILNGSVTGGTATLQFIGMPGSFYFIQASTNLKSWTLVGGATAGTNGLFQFQDPNAGQYPDRYYRTVLLP